MKLRGKERGNKNTLWPYDAVAQHTLKLHKTGKTFSMMMIVLERKRKGNSVRAKRSKERA